MNWSPTVFDRCCRDYSATWSFTDDALYRLCREHPDHSSLNSLNAKLWIIGRTYATGIERKVPTDGRQGGALTRLAKHMLSCRRSLDAIFGRLKTVAEPLSPDQLAVIAAEHGKFVGLLKPLLRREQSPRAFASKYMHFHCPAVPIYDSVAAGVIPKLVRWRGGLAVFDEPSDADQEYARYVMRFWHLYERARRDRPSLSVRLLDWYLISAADTAHV